MEGSARPGRRHRAGALAGVIAGVPGGVRVLLCTEPTDMRKSFDGLIAATKSVIGENPLSGNLFVFVNRQGNYAKALYWQRGGFCLWAKKLERGRFARIASEAASVTMTDTQLMMWLDGIELGEVRHRKRFELPAAASTSATMAR